MLAFTAMNLVAIVSGVVGLAILLGGAAAIGYTHFRKTARDVLRQENEDVNKRLDSVEKSEQQCQLRLAKAESTIQTLTDVFSGHNSVVELKAVVNDNHQTVIEKLDELRRQIAPSA